MTQNDQAAMNEQLTQLRLQGFSIDGDNRYKQDLIDAVIGAIMFGAQGAKPPPAGHWLEQFYVIGREEREARAAQPAADDHDQMHQLAFEVGEPDEDGDGYHFSAEQLDEFVSKLNRAALATQPAAGEPKPIGYIHDRWKDNLEGVYHFTTLVRDKHKGWETPVFLTPPAAAPVAAGEPVAYAAFADNGNIQMWCKAGIDAARIFESTGKKPVPLYLAPPAAAHGDEAVRKDAQSGSNCDD